MTTAAITPARLAQLLDVDLRTVQRFVERGLLPKPEQRNPVAWNDPRKLAAALMALELKRGARMAKIAAVQMLDEVY
jgi:phage terminase Nu1 subunit (DNA packaging protein)